MPEQQSSDREKALKVRIRKMLELAFHPNTGEAESGQALRNAQKLMQAHHLEEADVLCGVQGREDGGLQGVKLTPVDSRQPMRRNHEFWSKSLMVAVEITFSVATFIKREKTENADYIIFYGGNTGTELAAFAYTCASNRIDWMAGSRCRPPDEVFGRREEHAGKSFREVMNKYQGYVEWVKSTEFQSSEESEQVHRFIDYVRAWEDATAWDQAYKEGMASKLRKQAVVAQKQAEVTSDTLAVNYKAMQQRMVERLGLKMKKGSKLRSLDSCQQARLRGSADAASINLRQQQLEQGNHLSLPPPIDSP